MKNNLALLLITLFMGTCLNAQVKIGDNPQNIDPSSVLELESTDKVLVITRVTTIQMNAIVPIQGALCYNTEVQAVHYYDGTQWVNIGSGGGTGGPLTADPIVNPMSTIVITPTATGDNLEVAPNSISSAQIIDGGVNGVDIQDGSIGPGKLQNNSVTEEKLSENSVGAFALDNDNIGVSAFNNDAGYITAGDLDSSVSADANNAVVAGTDGGAFYDDTNLMNDVLDNATAIAADDDQSSSNELQNPSLTGTVIGLSGTAGTIDIGPLLSGGGSDDQNLETPVLSAANLLTLNIEGGNPTSVDLSSLAGSGGSTEVVDNATLTGVGTAVDPFKIEPSATVGRFLSTDVSGIVLWADLPTGSGGTVTTDGTTILGTGLALSPLGVPAGGITSTEIQNASILGEDINQMTATNGQVLTWDDTAANWIPGTSGGSGSTEEVDNITLEGIGTNGDPFKIKPGAGDQILRTATDGLSVAWVNLPTGAAAFTDATLTGDGTSALTALGIAPASDLTPAADQMLITTDAGDIAWAQISGTAKSIFYADQLTGLPTTADDNAFLNDDGDFFWDPEGRKVGATGYGALYIGLPGDINALPTGDAKVHIADNFPGIAYALKLQNTSATTTANARGTGILFSTEGTGDYGKGSLIYEYQASFARGDFHFLQDDNLDTTNPEITNKAFTVKNNKDIVVYGGIETSNGIGTAGYVLSSQGIGNPVQWIPAGGGTAYTAGTGLTLTVSDFSVDDLVGEVSGPTTATVITNNAVTTGKIANATIIAEDLADMGAGNNEVLKWNGTNWAPAVDAGGTAYTAGTGLTLTGSNFSVDDLVGEVFGPTTATVITNNVVTSAKIFDGTIAAIDIADGAIIGGTGGVIADNSITASDIQNDAVDVGEIRMDAVRASEIQTGAVETDEILDGTIMDIDISTGAAIDGTKINPNFGAQDIVTTGNIAGADFNATGNLDVGGSVTVQGFPEHPDYVFQKYFLGNSELKLDYDFASLEEIEAFVKKYHHLPGIKSAEQVKSEGVWNLSESNIQNLEKIEELFLHTIEQEKKIKSLASDKESLLNELEQIKKDIEEIKALLKDK